MMVNTIFMYGLVSYRKEQLLFYCLCWTYLCYDGICFVHYSRITKATGEGPNGPPFELTNYNPNAKTDAALYSQH